ncbi:DUF2273 domain-containing protein [Streptococcus entericus]|uniref:DUF2273 domain-containing protein n=1 Tax=Streptococcus entericus TaxID=155680 RepID=UPI000379F9BA|nr:DUF2273 domain-containing protein [Streptococcus entericus]
MDFIREYKYAIAGAIIALLLMLIILSFGFFKTLLLVIIVALGAIIGHQFKDTGILEKYLIKLRNKL